MKKQTLAMLAGCLLLAAWAAPLLAQTGRDQLVGTIVQMDREGRFRLEERATGQSFWVELQRGAQIMLGNQRADASVLDRGANVRVRGVARANVFQASSVRVLGPRFEENWEPGLPEESRGRSNVLVGTVMAANARLRELTVQAPNGRMVVTVPANVTPRRGSTSVNLGDIGVGDRVRVVLAQEFDWTRPTFNRRATAREVQYLGPKPPVTQLPYPTGAFEGRVASVFSAERVLVVRTSRGSYAVDTRNAVLVSRGQTISFSQFRTGDRVRVDPYPSRYSRYGTLAPTAGFITVPARRVELLTPGRPEEVRVRGTVRDLDRDRMRFRLDSLRVQADRDTDYVRDGRRIELADIRNGDLVEVTGRRTDDTIEASRVNLLTTTGRFSVTGRVSDLDVRNRRFRVDEYLVLATRDTDFLRDGRSIELADLRNGDSVTVTGNRDNRTITATRVELESTTGQRVTQRGTISSIDDRGRTFRLGGTLTTYRVYVEPDADITRDGDNIEFEDINNGNRVEVSGWLSDGAMDADRVVRLD